jgi:hypothetical protein
MDMGFLIVGKNTAPERKKPAPLADGTGLKPWVAAKENTPEK